MAITKAQQQAVHRYVKANYDRIELTVPKGKKAQIRDFAAARGETVNGFICKLINSAMNDKSPESPLS